MHSKQDKKRKQYETPIMTIERQTMLLNVIAGSGIDCLSAGTKITMADGSVKNIENIVEGDKVQTFDHETGSKSYAPICMVYKSEVKKIPLNLTFASGRTTSFVGYHDLLLEDTRKYVRINSDNAASFVGKRFFNMDSGTWDSLVSYEIGAEPVDYYCIYSAYHLNCVADGMLSLPDDVDHILNIYELDANLKADADQLAADIAKYGLCDIARDFPEFLQYKERIEAFGSKYIYIAIGKGLVPESILDEMKAYWRGQ